MPELPEVETVRRDVARGYVGHELEHLVVTGRRTVRRHRPELLSTLDGSTLAGLGRHGKFLLFEWDDGRVLVGHLRMSGQLLAAQPGDPVAPHTHAVLAFKDAGELRFVDPRTFGELFLAGLGEEDGERQGAPRTDVLGPRDRVAELRHLGPDALTVDWAHFQRALAGRRAPLKSLLVDQRVVAGIGNIYADEIAFAARLRPDRPGGSLKRNNLQRLAESTRTVLGAAIAARGSSLADEQYRDLFGVSGRYQLEHKVYDRLGQKCASCGHDIERVHFGAKSAYFCRKCQK